MAFEPVRKPSASSSPASVQEGRRKQPQGNVSTARSRESTLPRYLRDELQQAPKTNPKAQPGEIDLSKGMLDASTVRLDENGRAMARLGNLAAGELELVEGEGGYSTTGQGAALPLSLPPLDGILGGRLVLVVSIENNVITGHAALGKPGRAVPRNDSSLLGMLGKEPEALGLQGLSKLGIKSIHNTLENGVLKLGAESVDFTLSGFVTGSGQLGFENGQVSFGGQAEVKLPGGSGGKLQVSYSPETGLSGETHLEVSIGKVSGGADARLNQGVLDIQGTASYAGDRLKGSITLLATDAATARDITTKDPQAGGLPTPGGEGAPSAAPGAASPGAAGAQAKPGPRAFCGWGELDFSLTEWLTGKAKVVVGSTGEATVRGEIAPPKEIILFEQKEWTKSLLKLEARAAYGLPVVGNVFVFANVGLEALATIGPGKLYNIKLSGQYSTDKRVDKELNLQATLNISAFAGLRLRAEGGVGVELLGHDIKAGVGVWALTGVRGYVEATPIIGYRQKAGAAGEFYIQGHMELAAQPFLGLGGDLFFEVDSPWWSPLPDDKWTWPLGSLEYPLPGEFGIGADVEHVLGSKQWPAVKFTEVEFDGGKFMSDLLSQSVPGKSKGGEDHQPAKWDEGGAAAAPAGGKKGAGGKSASAPAKAPAPGGKKGSKKSASTKPAEDKIRPGKDSKGKPGKGKPGKDEGERVGEEGGETVPKTLVEPHSATMNKVSPALARELATIKSGSVVYKAGGDPRQVTKKLLAEHQDARYDRPSGQLTLPPVKHDPLERSESVAEVGAKIAQQTGVSKVMVTRSDRGISFDGNINPTVVGLATYSGALKNLDPLIKEIEKHAQNLLPSQQFFRSICREAADRHGATVTFDEPAWPAYKTTAHFKHGVSGETFDAEIVQIYKDDVCPACGTVTETIGSGGAFSGRVGDTRPHSVISQSVWEKAIEGVFHKFGVTTQDRWVKKIISAGTSTKGPAVTEDAQCKTCDNAQGPWTLLKRHAGHAPASVPVGNQYAKATQAQLEQFTKDKIEDIIHDKLFGIKKTLEQPAGTQDRPLTSQVYTNIINPPGGSKIDAFLQTLRADVLAAAR
ncbi:MAG TPA: hypothetical protein VFZ09_03435 [Archangium sp.]|uniref:hypothetical protein n=1 Tax=Archangium sp. TaxID=1872627 RepID=UPI002E363CBE|nr:hypothetical protein [Archangium sp.]HEX5745269.1 hypothetical protein [Archangium sp.]